MNLGRTAWMFLLAGAILTLAACSNGAASQTTEVTGNTGMCTNSATRFSGEPLPGTNLPGSVMESVVTCPMSEMSDDRLSGTAESEFRCEYSNRDGEIVAECVSNTVVTNDGGTWHEEGGTFMITGTEIGVQGVVAQEGVRVGTGDYEGLQFAYRIEGIEHTYPWPITGTIEPTG
jgi:hypothetical protein